MTLVLTSRPQTAPVERSRPLPRLAPAGLTEAELSHLWDGQRFPAGALSTRDGASLRVVYRGRRNTGAGPDFRDAIVAAPWGLLQGDVELHVRSSDFRRHGHDRDPAYDGLALHLVFRDDEGRDTVVSSGRSVPVVALADWVDGRTAEVRIWLMRPVQWEEPCRSAVPRLGERKTGAALDRLGVTRFRRKGAKLAKRLAAVEEPGQLLWEGILEGLGYGGDSASFRLLAAGVPWARLRRRLLTLSSSAREDEALCLLSAGLAELAGAERDVRPARPGNAPQARLHGAARLAARFAGAGLPDALFRPLDSEEEAGPGLLKLLSVPGAIGRSRALEITANAVLPLLAALGPEPAGRAERIYARLPLSARYGAVRHLHQAVGADVRITTRRQQGMLYLLKEYCTQGGCGRCPLS